MIKKRMTEVIISIESLWRAFFLRALRILKLSQYSPEKRREI